MLALSRFCRKPACRRAEDILKMILAGEAGPEEKEAFAAHLRACPSCSRRLGKTMLMAHTLRTALTETGERVREPGRLDLPERRGGDGRIGRFRSVLVDFSLLIVVGLGLFLLVAVAVLGYRSVAREYEQTRRFTAVQEVLRLTRAGDRLARQGSGLTLSAILRTLQELTRQGRRHIRLIDPWGRPYLCAVEHGRFSVRSLGPNGRDDGGGGDDITTRTEAPALGRAPPAPGGPRR